MKTFHALAIVSLVLFVGCAKNSEVAALKSDVASLKEKVSAAEGNYQAKADSMESKLEELQQEVKQLKASESEMAEDATFERQTREDATKDSSKLELRLLGIELSLKAIDSSLDTKADGLEFLELKQRLDAFTNRTTDQIEELETLLVGEGGMSTPANEALAEAKGTFENRIGDLEHNVHVIDNMLKIYPPLYPPKFDTP